MKKIFTDQQEQGIISEYLAGQNTRELGSQYDVSDATIRNTLKRHNIPRRKGGHIAPSFNDQYFVNIDTERKAYLLGLIAADGSVCNPKGKSWLFQLELLSSDAYLIELLCEELGYPKERLYKIQRANRKPTSRITIYSESLCESLRNYGIVSGKAKTFKMPELHFTLERHFLRGLFDGDGSIAKYRLTLAAGNKTLLMEVKTLLDITLQLNAEASKIYKTGESTWTLSYNRKLERNQVLNYLYCQNTIAMSRKAQFKPRELLGHPEEGNQQPSPESNLSEGSTTSSNDPIGIMKDHERGALESIPPFTERHMPIIKSGYPKLSF